MDMEEQRESKASASSVHAVRNIVIVGNTGREKTIAERIVGSAEEISCTDTGDVQRNGDVLCKTKIIDIRSEGVYYQGALFDPNSDEFFRQVHLVLFVVHCEYYIGIGDMLKHLQKCVSSISALLLIGCEGTDEAARKRTVEVFRHNSLSEGVDEFMKKDIHAVGFPNISDKKGKLREEFADETKEDEKKLRDMIGQQNSPVDIREMFIKKRQQPADMTRELQQHTHTMAEEGRTASRSPAYLADKLERIAERQVEVTSKLETALQKHKDITRDVKTLRDQIQPTAESRSFCSIL